MNSSKCCLFISIVLITGLGICGFIFRDEIIKQYYNISGNSESTNFDEETYDDPIITNSTDFDYTDYYDNRNEVETTTRKLYTTITSTVPPIISTSSGKVIEESGSEALMYQPEFADPIVNISVAIGRDATFTCHVKHLGGYRVGWVKADTKAIQAIHDHVITHNPRVSVTHLDVNTWNLHIKSVTEEDRGGYMCQINTDPMKSQIGYLDVVIPPDFIQEETSSDLIVPEGGSVRLTCRARGYPTPVVTWRREDGNEIILKDSMGTKTPVTSFRGEVLKLAKIGRNEMGSYLCIASNSVPPSVSKRISLNIHFHPVIHVPNQLVGAPLNTDVSIECHVEASPRSINYWIKDTGEMIVSSSKYIVQEHSKSLYEMKMTVIVKKFEKEDIGSYRCIAKNSLGEVDSSIRLYEIPGPTRKVPPPKHSGSDTNEIVKNSKNSLNSGKEPLVIVPPKGNYHNQEYDDNYSSSEDEDIDDRNDPTKNVPMQTHATRKPNIHINKISNNIDSYENNGIMDSRGHHHHRWHLALHTITLSSSIILSHYSRLIT